MANSNEELSRARNCNENLTYISLDYEFLDIYEKF